jgi:2-dehydro-3-deoxygalactonokinase
MLIAVDWGTSQLRAWLMDARGQVVARQEAALGISQIPAGGFPEAWASFAGAWLSEQPHAVVLMCGMVGARQGWREAPYLPCPAGLHDLAGALMSLPDAGERAWVVPGLKVRGARHVPDVMRGEETQAMGCWHALTQQQPEASLGELRVVMPGTHSKWLRLAQGQVVEFATYMTGEIYGLLAQHSLLARMLPQPTDDEWSPEAFEEGVLRAVQSGDSLLHSLFAVRTLALFDEMPPEERRSYLSGLLIGEELRTQLPSLQQGQRDRVAPPIAVVASPALGLRYQAALALFGVAAQPAEADVTAQGLWQLAHHAELL